MLPSPTLWRRKCPPLDSFFPFQQLSLIYREESFHVIPWESQKKTSFCLWLTSWKTTLLLSGISQLYLFCKLSSCWLFRSVCLTLCSSSSSELSVASSQGRRTFPCMKNYSCSKCIGHSKMIREPFSLLLGYILLTKKHIYNKLWTNRLGS